MPPPDTVKLGPITRVVLDRAAWRAESVFPSTQNWADEVERVLGFLDSQGVLERFLPRLYARETERDGALAEARMGFLFARWGFRILEWEPQESAKGGPGDLDIQWRDTAPVFVEVKGPGWRGELSEGELAAKRQKAPKYVNAEARSIDPVERVEYAIGKALPKLASTRANLVAVVDDLFHSPLEIPTVLVDSRLELVLARPENRIVGGVLLMSPVSHQAPVEYRTRFVQNLHAGRPLPDAVIAGLLANNREA